MSIFGRISGFERLDCVMLFWRSWNVSKEGREPAEVIRWIERRDNDCMILASVFL